MKVIRGRLAWLVGQHPRRTAARLVALVLVSAVLFGWVLKPVRTFGPSMRPTLDAGRLVFVNALAYRMGRPARGDLAAVRLAGPSVLYIKRIVALPGERLRIDHGQVLINGRPLDEPYVPERAPWMLNEVQLGEDEYFLVGDNRVMPMRDHTMGRARLNRLAGRVLW